LNRTDKESILLLAAIVAALAVVLVAVWVINA
jgi:hypothetical protein